MAARSTVTLSPLDQLMPPTYTRIFLVFETADPSEAVGRLRSGLADLGSRLPYLRGRISSNKTGGRTQLEISWSVTDDPPLTLVEIAAPAKMPSVHELQRTEAPLHHFVNELSPLSVLTPERDAPVLSASYSTLTGGLTLCYCVHHAAMDGAGVAELAGIWAACVRGNIDSILADAAEPLHRLERIRRAVGVVGPEADQEERNLSFTDLLSKHAEYHLLSSASAAPLAPALALPPTTSRIFRFSTAKLVQLREILATTIGAEMGSLSINNLLSTLLWSGITRVRLARRGHPGAGLEGKSRLGFAVDGRKRLGTDFVQGQYLGNVNLYGLAEVSLATLESAATLVFDQLTQPDGPNAAVSAFAAIADAVYSAIARITAAHIGEVLSLVEQAPDMSDIGPGWQGFHGLDMAITSWANQGMYGVDFGESLGRPQFVRVPFAQFDGLAIVLPRRRNLDEKLDVVCFLAVDDIEALQRNEVWKSWN